MAKTGAEIRNEMKEIEQSFHIEAYSSMRQLVLSLYTFRENHLLFKELLEYHNNINLIHSDVFKRKLLRWEYHPLEQKIYQLFLNFVASAKALIDHTRNNVKNLYLETSFYKEYQDKVDKELKSVPVRAFVQDLRSYILHNKFPFVSPQFKLQRVSPVGSSENLAVPEIKLILSKQQLLRWDGWTKPSKRYLEAQDDQIPIVTFVDEYYLLIDNFYVWLDKRQREMHELEYSRLLDQWEELYHELEEIISANYKKS